MQRGATSALEGVQDCDTLIEQSPNFSNNKHTCTTKNASNTILYTYKPHLLNYSNKAYTCQLNTLIQ